MVQIIKAGLDDFETIQGMAKIVWPHTYGKILHAEQLDYMFDMMYSREAFTEQISLKNHHFLLGMDESGYVGFASYECNYSTGLTKIHKIYIMPDAQGKGVGRAFMTAISNIAKQNSNDALTLNVNRYNEAVRFYEALGFIRKGEEDIQIGQGYLMEDYIMYREI